MFDINDFDETAPGPWEWDLKRLFSDAMGSRAEMGLEDLRREVMRLSRIEQQKY